MDMNQVADLRQRFDRGEATTDDLRELSNTYLADNDLEKAYPYLCRLAEVETEGCQASVAAGLVALSLHKEDDAESHFTRAVNNSPNDYDANHNLGLLNLLRGRLDRARAVFENLASLHPDQPAIFNDLAIVWARMGKPAEVLKSLEKALALDPEYDQARQQAEGYAAQLGLLEASGEVDSAAATGGAGDQMDASEKQRWMKLIGRPENASPSQEHTGTVSMKGAGDVAQVAGKKLLFIAPQTSFLTDIIRQVGKHNEVKVYDGARVNETVDLMEWADLAWFEWCDKPLIAATRQPKSCPIICRLHSGEAFTELPAQVTWGRVDHLLFVNRSVQGLFTRSQSVRPSMSIIPNAVDLDRFYLPEDKAYNKKIAVVGYLNYKKNPALLLYCFKKIYEYDNEYTLHVAGLHQDPRIKLYFDHFLSENPLPVCYEGWVDDMPRWLEDKSYVMSTSLFEAFHYSVAEGMASGLMPLIHNWYGAAGLYPSEYLFDDPDDCLALIKRLEQVDRPLLARKNREFIASKYDVNQITDQIMRLMAGVLHTGHGVAVE